MTVGRASLPYLVWYRHLWKQLRCQLNTHRLYEEYKILWLEFDLCGLRHQHGATDPTLDKRITHWRWYLLEKKARAGENPEYTPITHLGTNIREVRTTNRVVFTQEQTYLFVQRFIQYYQEKEDCELHYHVLGLN